MGLNLEMFVIVGGVFCLFSKRWEPLRTTIPGVPNFLITGPDGSDSDITVYVLLLQVFAFFRWILKCGHSCNVF
jgi:hypothetical protein